MPSMKVPKAVSNKVDMVIEQLEWVWKAKKEWIQNNPYSKEIYSKVIDDIDNGNAPQNYKDMQEPYTKKVVEELDTILDDVKSQKWEWGEAFNLLRQDQTPIDTTVEIKSMNDLLKWTDYNLKTFLNRVDKWNLLGTRKILDNTATISTLHDIRKWLDDLMLKAQANKDSWEFKILKDMRKIVDGKLKENPDRVKADEEWARISKDIQEIEEGITYREQRKKWQIRDNIDSIIENINNPAKAKLRERLLQYMPDIWERISAIRGIPEIAKAYTTIPQWVIGRTAGALWWVAIWSTGWIPWMILWWIAWMFADVWLSQLRRNAIKKAIAKQSPKALEKLWEIQKAIADGKKLRAEQVIELQNFTNNLKKSLPANDKELINKVSELPKVMKTSLVPVKEWALESRWYTQKFTSPKREITEINPTAWKTYTARDILEEMRAKKNKSNVSSKIDTIKAKDNQNIAVNKTEALKKELKWVKSDTLVSKSDSMSNKNIIKDTPKTIEVWIKSKFSDKWSYKEVPVIRKVENTTLYQWWSDWKRQFWTTDKKYAEQFWKVQSKKWDFYQVDNGNRVIDVYVEAKPSIWEKLDSLKPKSLYKSPIQNLEKANNDIFNYSEGNYIPIKEWDELLYNTKDLIVDGERVYKQFKWEIKTKKLLDEKVDMVRKYSYMRKRLELGDILDYKELYKKLPELKKVDVHIMNDPKSWYAAMWDWTNITINVSKLKDNKEIKNSILHELQHKIQDIYDLPRWSNTSEVRKLKNLWWNIDEMLWQSNSIRSRGNKTINWEHIPEKLISEFENRLKELKWKFNTFMEKLEINDRYEQTVEWIELKRNIVDEINKLFWWIDFLRIYRKVPWEKWARLAWWDEPLFAWDISFAFWKKLPKIPTP